MCLLQCNIKQKGFVSTSEERNKRHKEEGLLGKQVTGTSIHPSGVFSSVSPTQQVLDAEQLLDGSTDMDIAPSKTASSP